MRYYIIDYQGNIWAESTDITKIKAILNNYTKQEIKENELEIIEGL